MNYKPSYSNIFASVRSHLDDEITNDVTFMQMSMKNGHNFSFLYLKIVADELTAYNELSNLSCFCSTKFFLNQ